LENRLADFVKLSPIDTSEQVIVQKTRCFIDILVSVNRLGKRKKHSFSSKEIEKNGKRNTIESMVMKIHPSEHDEKKNGMETCLRGSIAS
jgi:hypothetical protein